MSAVCSKCGREWRIGYRCCEGGWAMTREEYDLWTTLQEIRSLPETKQ